MKVTTVNNMNGLGCAEPFSMPSLGDLQTITVPTLLSPLPSLTPQPMVAPPLSLTCKLTGFIQANPIVSLGIVFMLASLAKEGRR